MNKKIRTWKCPCGRVHEVNGQEIRCFGPGHYVTLKPAYFTYRQKETETLIKNQYALF